MLLDKYTIMLFDTPVCVVENDKIVQVFRKDRIPFLLDCENPDWDYFYEDRVFPKERQNCRSLLKQLEVDFWEPRLICEKTHGIVAHDDYWFRFGDELNPIKSRRGKIIG